MTYYQEWRDRKLAENPHYFRDRARQTRGSKEKIVECPVCGKVFKTYIKHKKTCSEDCSIEYNKEQHRKREKTRREYHRQYQKEQREKKLIEEYGSLQAYEDFKVKRKKEKERQRQIEREAKIQTKRCPVCGNEFKTLIKNQKYCSKKCSTRAEQARKSKRIPKNQFVDRDITLERLYRRDKGICYLCGKSCSWNDIDKENHLVGHDYPTIDHIYPVARGGTHSWENVRLACWSCNISKSDTLLPNVEQLVPENARKESKKTKRSKKKTLQFTKSGELIAEYESTFDAARQTGFKAKGIQNCARGEIITYKGYKWQYA